MTVAGRSAWADTLTGELLAVVEQTMQPTQASLWLRPQPSSGTTGMDMARQPH